MESLRKLLLIALTTVLFAKSIVFAANLDSPNYRLVNPELQSAAGEASSINYKALFMAGSEGVSYGKVSSALYGIGSGQAYTFMANVPKISCFETSTNNGTTQCTELPNGMTAICGNPGCYDRAILQIDTQNNPTDTLYLIEVSPDNFVTNYVVSGVTRTLKSYTSKSSADYLTKVQWEAAPWQQVTILGLKPNTQYSARVRALHGNYTESSTGPTVIATTAVTSASLDLDIATDFNTENNPPYSINLGNLAPEVGKILGTPQIKIDFSTNAQQGATIFVSDSFSGLKSSSTNYLLTSSSEDLATSVSGDGFGLQAFDKTQASESNGFATISSFYATTASNVGAVSSTVLNIIGCSKTAVLSDCSGGTSTWITGGSILVRVGARASLNAPTNSDYSDSLSFTLSGNW
jgi:hypothetical protein